MPQLVEQLPESKSFTSTEKYPWGEWFDGQPRLFVQGEDYTTPTRSFCSVAHSAAKRKGLRLATRLAPNGVFLQAFPGE